MSDIVLRGLLLPESRTQVSNTSNTNNGSILKSLQLDESENQGAESLNMADHLKLSENTAKGSKGSVPIQLMNPNEIQGSAKKPSSLNARFNELISLEVSSKPSRTQSKPTNSNQTLAGLKPSSGSYTASTNATYSQTSTNGTKISGSYSTTTAANVSSVSKNDLVGDKINTAIEKIKTWDRKLGILDSEINKQESGVFDQFKLTSRLSQASTAKKDAVVSREDALKAYSDVMKEINSAGGISSGSFPQYKSAYLRMEADFSAASERDKGTMTKAYDYLKGYMTPENVTKLKNYLNPFN